MDFKFEYNHILVVSATAWLVAQIIKTVLHVIRYKTFDMERLVGAGGMPSSHSAFVCSAVVSVARIKGTTSCIEFAIILIIALIVMYDAMGVRRAAGLHAREINRMTKFIEDEFDEDDKFTPPQKQLKEFLGHTPVQVISGAILGIIIAMIFPLVPMVK